MTKVSRAFLTFNPELEVASSLDVKSLDEGNTDVDAAAEMPLQNEWKVWEQIETPSGSTETASGSYTDNMKPISAFTTVQVRIVVLYNTIYKNI